MGPLSESLIGLVYPRLCAACGQCLGGAERLFCAGCVDAVSGIKGTLCSICGVPFDGGTGDDHPCSDCIRKRPPYDMARAAVIYEGAVKEAIHLYKYRPMKSLGGWLGSLAAGCAARFFSDVDVAVAVPLHKVRLAHRGFNQSLFIARAAAEPLGAELSIDGLARTRHTRPQVDLSPRERAQNVRGAFSVVRQDEFAGRRVMLVDDVYTTGETVKECSRVLKAAGAVSVSVLTVARAV